MTSDNSHSTCGCKSLGPMDLYMSGFFKCPLIQSPPLRGSLLAPGFHSGFRGLGLQKAGLTVKNWVKEGIHYLLFLYFICHQCAYLIQSGSTLFSLLPLLDCLLVKIGLSRAWKSTSSPELLSRDVFHGILPNRSLKRPKAGLLKFWAGVCVLALLLPCVLP